MGAAVRTFLTLVLGIVVGAALVLGYFESNPRLSIALAAPPSTRPTAAAPAAVAPVPVPATLREGDGSWRPIFQDEDLLADLYDRVSPSVVNITVRTRLSGSGNVPEFEQGTGSGIILDTEGHILTNNHVVGDGGRLVVTLADGTKLNARLVGSDPLSDLAVVRVQTSPEKLHPAVLGDSDHVRVGQLAVAIGNPFGLERSLTTGVISAVGRVRPSGMGRRSIPNMIQTDAAINPGNSGGPLLNSAGEVIGINTQIQTAGGIRGNMGVGFAVPVNAAKRALPDLLAGRKVQHPWLGISGVAVSEDLAEEYNLPVKEGVLVAEVLPDSPAAQAGLRGGGRRDPASGDIVLTLDGRNVKAVEDIVSYLDGRNVGDRVTLTFLRDGVPHTTEVTLAAWPDNLTR
ncbi:MAG TPA: trypsin-like peptidase domain-containing protein [Chloroflexota bacterium]|nr:trypsin-like peptidase domain-containing protein [Chloroflexota bacterium]